MLSLFGSFQANTCVFARLVWIGLKAVNQTLVWTKQFDQNILKNVRWSLNVAKQTITDQDSVEAQI